MKLSLDSHVNTWAAMRNLVQVNWSNFGVAASYLLVLGTAAVASDCILGGTEVISAVLREGGGVL